LSDLKLGQSIPVGHPNSPLSVYVTPTLSLFICEKNN
jgi:hypothetical protein